LQIKSYKINVAIPQCVFVSNLPQCKVQKIATRCARARAWKKSNRE